LTAEGAKVVKARQEKARSEVVKARKKKVVTAAPRKATDNVEAETGKKKVKTLVQQQQESGSVQTTKAARIVFGGAVRKTLFRKVKFITSHSHLDFGAKVCRIILEKLTIDKNNVALCKKYWILHRSSVNKTLNGKRGNVNNEIKTRFMSMSVFVCVCASPLLQLLDQQQLTHYCLPFLCQICTPRGNSRPWKLCSCLGMTFQCLPSSRNTLYLALSDKTITRHMQLWIASRPTSPFRVRRTPWHTSRIATITGVPKPRMQSRMRRVKLCTPRQSGPRKTKLRPSSKVGRNR
jgi:hypothetical protein